ncbi:hypothetical protein ACIGEI_21490 [Pseudomonas sp. NPDC078863]|jgi:hypothetical protein|uniref:hypothetical protein n=1 Tax=Pseudomonas sp. NPDC078863 TaxID=3364425 RepID=UPI0037C4FDCB
MLKVEAASMASDAQTRTMPGCDALYVAHRVYGCVYKTSGTVLKVVSVELFTFSICLDWAVFYRHSIDGRASGAGKEAF